MQVSAAAYELAAAEAAAIEARQRLQAAEQQLQEGEALMNTLVLSTRLRVLVMAMVAGSTYIYNTWL